MSIRDKIHTSEFISRALVGTSIVAMSVGIYVLLNMFYSNILLGDTVLIQEMTSTTGWWTKAVNTALETNIDLNVVSRTIGLLFISITLFAGSNEQLTKQNIKKYGPIVVLFVVILHVDLLL